MTFTDHCRSVEETDRKTERNMSFIRAVANISWGWRKKDLKKVWTAHVTSILNYAAGRWKPCYSNSFVEKLERVQNMEVRMITGQSTSSQCEALRAEATACDVLFSKTLRNK